MKDAGAEMFTFHIETCSSEDECNALISAIKAEGDVKTCLCMQACVCMCVCVCVYVCTKVKGGVCAFVCIFVSVDLKAEGALSFVSVYVHVDDICAH